MFIPLFNSNSKLFLLPIPSNSFLNSVIILSIDTYSINFEFLQIALNVLFSILNPNLEEKRNALIILSASSKNRSLGLFTVFIILFVISLTPEWKS